MGGGGGSQTSREPGQTYKLLPLSLSENMSLGKTDSGSNNNFQLLFEVSAKLRFAGRVESIVPEAILEGSAPGSKSCLT